MRSFKGLQSNFVKPTNLTLLDGNAKQARRTNRSPQLFKLHDNLPTQHQLFSNKSWRAHESNFFCHYF